MTDTDWRPGALPPDWTELGLTDTGTGWQERGLCAQTDPEAFFPEKGASVREAKRTCLSCDVRAECLEYALTNSERFGIWGGLTEHERRKIAHGAPLPTFEPASTTRVCKACEEEKPLTEYNRDGTSYQTSCKSCRAVRWRAWDAGRREGAA